MTIPTTSTTAPALPIREYQYHHPVTLADYYSRPCLQIGCPSPVHSVTLDLLDVTEWLRQERPEWLQASPADPVPAPALAPSPIDLTRALATEGWMTDLELAYLARTAQRSRQIVEVGAWMGRSTCALAANAPDGASVWAVDTWLGSPEHQDMLRQRPAGWLQQQFLANTAGLPVIPVRMASVDAARLRQQLQLPPVDLVFIDGGHDYDSVRADIAAWQPLLASGGILCGHDFTEAWDGVRRAVREMVPQFRVVEGTAIWTTEAAGAAGAAG